MTRGANVEDVHALSPLQKGILFHTLFEEGSGLYFEQSVSTIQGALDVPAFRRAWQQILDRHSALRSSFHWEDLANPAQVVHRHVALPFHQEDWRQLDASERDDRLQAFLRTDRGRGFDLASSPLMRTALLRTSDEGWEFVLSFQHILLDRWSRFLILREAFAIYRQLREGREPAMAAARPYSSYIAWLGAQDPGAAETYWRNALRGFERPIAFELGRPASEEREEEAAEARLELSEEATARLTAFGRAHGLTLNTLVQAAWSILASRYTGEPDVVTGATVSGRPPELPEVESMVGLFINTLPVRVKVDPQATLLPWLRALQEDLVALRQYEYSFLLDVQKWSDIPPGTPLFENLLVFENVGRGSSDLDLGPGVRVVGTRSVGSRTNYPLTVLAMPGRRLVLRATSENARFSREVLTQILRHLARLLEAMPEEPERRLGSLPLLVESERRQLLIEWNRTEAEYSRGSCVHQLFEKQVERSPDAVAVSFGRERLTYAELNRRANQLARHLRSLGVGPEVRVGIALERSAEIVVGVLGILKAGGAYVPMDPSDPAERRNFMLEDSGARVFLTGREFSEALPSTVTHTVSFERDSTAISRRESADFPVPLSADNLAYVIYTSGSTGLPKGVEVTHESVVNLLWAMRSQLASGPDDRWLFLTRLSFDIAGLEIYLPLLTGGSLEVVSSEVASDPVRLQQVLAASRATTIQATPATWKMLVEAGWPGDPRLKALSGGEALPGRLADQLLERCGVLWNLYGPTETTIWSAVARVQPESGSRGWVPIGNPLANTQIFVLDAGLQPSPLGVAGEIFIGGAGLARGYARRPQLTAETFLPNPWGGVGERLYRTGDHGRRRKDGTVEFLGRKDDQVKVRGYRIELGEIESVAREIPEIRDCVVLAREQEGEKQLVAYVTRRPGTVRGEARPPQDDALTQWRSLWDDTYLSGPPAPIALDTAGWNSSYTGLPIPAGEMLEWADHTADRILSFGPRRVLEVGAGTGLLLFRVAPHCEAYEATDFSEVVVAQLKRRLGEETKRWGHVSVSRQSAEDLRGRAPGSFDAVILNSVVQYFPDADYLARVVEGAIALVEPGGFIFLGDLRSLPLLEAFHASVQVHRSPGSMSLPEVRQRLRAGVRHEEELVVAPDSFQALAHASGRRVRVEVRPKRGRSHNEMTRFRYDVILHVDGAEVPEARVAWRRWQEEGWSLETLGALLTTEAPGTLGFLGVPNARTLPDVEALERIQHGEGGTLESLRDSQDHRKASGVDPEGFWELGESHSYAVQLSWAEGNPDGRYDVLLHREPAGGEAGHPAVVFPRRLAASQPIPGYANDPAWGQGARQLVPRLKSYLAQRLPAYMVPSGFLVLDELPLTPHGKVDRRSLSALAAGPVARNYVPPRNPTEEAVAEIWIQLLGVERVGVHDNFFELGGHSLLATQVVSRVARSLGLRIPLRRVFDEPTLEGLATSIGQDLASRAEGEDEMLRMLAEVRGLSDEEARSRLVSEGRPDPEGAAPRAS